ncbi:hypothetical protein LTR37_001419 [Vermiconidia calcicola]|uniref:Uncharacterized protein n=1 Tax=Vermiconidia calcicola TaxID=1690605 RepID=A0ACC3NYC7_9PEZI|nr:hypothetical protein LTR37_001419 [Vermiconidia calcicola]
MAFHPHRNLGALPPTRGCKPLFAAAVGEVYRAWTVSLDSKVLEPCVCVPFTGHPLFQDPVSVELKLDISNFYLVDGDETNDESVARQSAEMTGRLRRLLPKLTSVFVEAGLPFVSPAYLRSIGSALSMNKGRCGIDCTPYPTDMEEEKEATQGAIMVIDGLRNLPIKMRLISFYSSVITLREQDVREVQPDSQSWWEEGC